MEGKAGVCRLFAFLSKNMKYIKLSQRLLTVASFAAPCRTAVDVGTDHGYLAVWLLQSGLVQRVTATDIHAGPLARGRATAAEYAMDGKIHFELCDGLQFPDAETMDTIFIAGMGGETICSILSAAPWTKNGRHLILQPQSKLQELTEWLQTHGYTLADAKLCRDAGKFYLILDVWGRLPCIQTQAVELLLRNRDPLLPSYLEEQCTRLRRRIAGLACADRRDVSAELEQARQEQQIFMQYWKAVQTW